MGVWRKRIEQGIIWFLFRLAMFLANKIPFRYLHTLGGGIGGLVFYLLGKRKDIARENLRIVFGKDRNEKELREILRLSLKNLGKGLFEVITYYYLPPDFVAGQIDIEGEENLREALNQGKGVIALSAHLGNFTIIGAKLAQNYSFNYIIHLPHERNIAGFIEGVLERAHVGLIPDRPRVTCVKRSIGCLRNNEILFIQLDISAIDSAVSIDFFGQPVATYTGPVIFSLKTGAPILPMFILRNQDNRHKIVIEPPVELTTSSDKDNDIQVNTSRLTKVMESYVLRYPEHWFWLHRRWKRARKNVKLIEYAK
ncbi:MAG: lysophospholipid acyltransferase family protein [Deltaproteobacteria bacterium]|nr:MAG: lysophospholipid acyltransferase family protein [Deltaproteobacteria bacterium]